MAKIAKILLCGIASFSLIGCATIIGDSTQLVPISSTPSGATVVIKDETNNELYNGTTPTTVEAVEKPENIEEMSGNRKGKEIK